MNDVSPTPMVAHDGTDAEARPVFAEERRVLGLPVSTWPGIIAPIAIGIVMLCRVGSDGPHQGHPVLHPAGPAADRADAVSDWGTLSGALLITLRITFAALIAAVTVGVSLAIIFTQSKWLEKSLFPYAVILQVTPIVAIAPLIIIWVGDINLSLLICAWIVAFFPILSNTILGLNSADHNLINLFQLYGATRWQTLRYPATAGRAAVLPRRPEDFRRPCADRRSRGGVRRRLGRQRLGACLSHPRMRLPAADSRACSRRCC